MILILLERRYWEHGLFNSKLFISSDPSNLKMNSFCLVLIDFLIFHLFEKLFIFLKNLDSPWFHPQNLKFLKNLFTRVL